MVNQICFKPSIFYSFMAIGLFIIGWALYQVYLQSLENNQLKEEAKKISDLEDLTSEMQEKIIKIKNKKQIANSKLQELEEIQKQQLSQPPPQSPSQLPSQVLGIYPQVTSQVPGIYPQVTPQVTSQVPGVPVYVPSRGEPSDFYVVGYIANKRNSNEMMQLMERYLYSGKYEYCTTHHIDPNIKIPIYTKNLDQLTDGDIIRVAGYRGKFIVHIYPPGSPTFLPYP